MICKTFEIRDKGTFIPVMAVKLEPGGDRDRYLLARSGFSSRPETQAEYILVIRLAGGGDGAHSDPYEWPGQSRTMQVAHQDIIENFDRLASGAVICVEHIMGELPEPKKSEQETDRYA